MERNCWHCHKPLPLTKLLKKELFCSAAHEEAYFNEQTAAAFERMKVAEPTSKPALVMAPEPVPGPVEPAPEENPLPMAPLFKAEMISPQEGHRPTIVSGDPVATANETVQWCEPHRQPQREVALQLAAATRIREGSAAPPAQTEIAGAFPDLEFAGEIAQNLNRPSGGQASRPAQHLQYVPTWSESASPASIREGSIFPQPLAEIGAGAFPLVASSGDAAQNVGRRDPRQHLQCVPVWTGASPASIRKGSIFPPPLAEIGGGAFPLAASSGVATENAGRRDPRQHLQCVPVWSGGASPASIREGSIFPQPEAEIGGGAFPAVAFAGQSATERTSRPRRHARYVSVWTGRAAFGSLWGGVSPEFGISPALSPSISSVEGRPQASLRSSLADRSGTLRQPAAAPDVWLVFVSSPASLNLNTLAAPRAWNADPPKPAECGTLAQGVTILRSDVAPQPVTIADFESPAGCLSTGGTALASSPCLRGSPTGSAWERKPMADPARVPFLTGPWTNRRNPVIAIRSTFDTVALRPAAADPLHIPISAVSGRIVHALPLSTELELSGTVRIQPANHDPARPTLTGADADFHASLAALNSAVDPLPAHAPVTTLRAAGVRPFLLERIPSVSFAVAQDLPRRVAGAVGYRFLQTRRPDPITSSRVAKPKPFQNIPAAPRSAAPVDHPLQPVTDEKRMNAIAALRSDSPESRVLPTADIRPFSFQRIPGVSFATAHKLPRTLADSAVSRFIQARRLDPIKSSWVTKPRATQSIPAAPHSAGSVDVSLQPVRDETRIGALPCLDPHHELACRVSGTNLAAPALAIRARNTRAGVFVQVGDASTEPRTSPSSPIRYQAASMLTTPLYAAATSLGWTRRGPSSVRFDIFATRDSKTATLDALGTPEFSNSIELARPANAKVRRITHIPAPAACFNLDMPLQDIVYRRGARTRV